MYNSRGKDMNIYVSNTSGKALYEQIYDQIKSKILDGELKEGEPLPTIRGLAKDLRISVITTARAYTELEKDGYIYSVVGRGSFVAEKSREFAREKHLAEMEKNISDAVDLARRCGVSEEEFIETVKIIFRG